MKIYLVSLRSILTALTKPINKYSADNIRENNEDIIYSYFININSIE
jgi:hypothetical protein